MAIATTSTGTMSSPGIGSGLDVKSIVSQLMTVEQQPLTRLSQKEASYQTKLTAYGSLKGALGSFQSAMQSLSSASSFQTLTASSGNSTVLAASAGITAKAGTYSVDVSHLAHSQVLAADGITSTQNSSSTGTLSIQVGSGSLQTITIDSSNNTLSGIAEAINAAGAGVTATIINDGSATPYKLVLSANATGAANTINVTNNLSAGELSTAVDSLAQVRAADDAALTVNGVTVSSASNNVSSVISGVSLNLLTTGSSTVTVTADTTSAQSAVTNFVKAYNDLNGMLNTLAGYNAKTKTGGPLMGDSTARSLQTQIRAVLSQNLAGIGGSLTTLSQVGVSFQKDGTLGLDTAKLASAASSNFSDLPALFAVRGKSNNTLLSFVSAAAKGTPGDYQVDITSAATRGTVTAGNTPAASTVIDAANDSLSITVNGIASGTLALAHGSYTPAQLASALQTSLNSAPAFSAAGITTAVTLDGGKLAVTSQSYGAASSVSTLVGSAIVALGFNGGENGTGTNVAGTFTLNGNTMAASGIGQILTGATGTAGEGVQIKYTGSASQVSAGTDGIINFSGGYATQLYKLATTALDDAGSLAGSSNGINKSLLDISNQRDVINRKLTSTEARYRKQFNSLDTLISNLNATGNFLTQQIQYLPTPGKTTSK